MRLPPPVRHHRASPWKSRRVQTVSAGQRYGMMVPAFPAMSLATILPDIVTVLHELLVGSLIKNAVGFINTFAN